MAAIFKMRKKSLHEIRKKEDTTKDKRESKCKLKLIGCSFIISREIHSAERKEDEGTQRAEQKRLFLVDKKCLIAEKVRVLKS